MDSLKRLGLCPQVHNHINVVRWSHVLSLALNLVQEDHLAANEQPILAEQRC